jgi:outer membrane protein assembly factor BamB
MISIGVLTKKHNRFRAVLVIITLMLLGTFYGLLNQSRVYAVTSADDWPMYHHDVAHTGYSDGNVPTTLPGQLWNYTLELDHPLSNPNPPAVTDGFVYLTSLYNLSCFDAFTGEIIWNFPIESYGRCAPAVVNGQVYVGSVNGVYCLDASSGLQVWNYSTNASFDSSPTVIHDLIYVESNYGDIYCLDAANGGKIFSRS